MALPAEPRQKMINIMYLVLTAILALNVSAEILTAFKTVDASLKNSNVNLTTANSTLYKSLEEKMSDPKTAEQAKIWQPKAEQAHKLADEMDSYINSLKQELKVAAGLRMKEGKEDFKEDNLDASTRTFETGGKGKELEEKLKAFKEALLNIDPEIRTQFATTLPIDLEPPVGVEGHKKDFTSAYFHMTPTVAALTMLSKFQNNVKNAENQVASFCHSKIGEVKVRFDKFGVLVGQSSNYVMPGQEIEITAGVGAYSSAAAPQISINGSGVQTIDGKGTYKLTASGTGPHKVPVTIRYKDQNGIDQTSTSEVEYTVGVPGGSAVMLDKMNVFYIGVDNPVTISSGSGWDKTTAAITGGTMTGSGSNRIVRVTTPGTAKITVTADGKSSSFDFRVKRIPDPVIKVGPSGGGRMQAVIFRSQPFVRADLENFDFEAKYNVTGATVYFSIPGVRNVMSVQLSSGSLAPAKQFMDQLVPGSTVTFDNIKVVGPDGQPRTIQNPPGFSLF